MIFRFRSRSVPLAGLFPFLVFTPVIRESMGLESGSDSVSFLSGLLGLEQKITAWAKNSQSTSHESVSAASPDISPCLKASNEKWKPNLLGQCVNEHFNKQDPPEMTETTFEKCNAYFDSVVWALSPPLTCRRKALWTLCLWCVCFQVTRVSQSFSLTSWTTSAACSRATTPTSPPPASSPKACRWAPRYPAPPRPLPRAAAACWVRTPAAAPGSWRATGAWRARVRDSAATRRCPPTSSSTVSPR